MLTRRASRRRGATVVESALVMGIFLMLLFGIFEYCRFLMVLHVANNAARDGARYATVNVNCDPDDVADLKDKILNHTRDRLGGRDSRFGGFDYQVAVYPCTSAGFAMSPPQAIPKSLSASPADPFNAGDANNPAWNQAVFTERIAVTVRGTYRPITPLLLLIPSEIPINVTAVMGSEG